MAKKRTVLDKAFDEMEAGKFTVKLKAKILRWHRDAIPMAEIVKMATKEWGKKNMVHYGIANDREAYEYFENFIEALSGVDPDSLGGKNVQSS